METYEREEHESGITIFVVPSFLCEDWVELGRVGLMSNNLQKKNNIKWYQLYELPEDGYWIEKGARSDNNKMWMNIFWGYSFFHVPSPSLDYLEHKSGKYMLPASEKKGITDLLIICQLYSFVMGELGVLNKLVLQAVNI